MAHELEGGLDEVELCLLRAIHVESDGRSRLFSVLGSSTLLNATIPPGSSKLKFVETSEPKPLAEPIGIPLLRTKEDKWIESNRRCIAKKIENTNSKETS